MLVLMLHTMVCLSQDVNTNPADVYADATAKCETLTKQIRQKEAEVLKLRKDNPACILGGLTRSIINLDKKYPVKEQKKYYFRQVTYVRPHFYCTGCKGEHDTKCRISAKQSWKRWRDHYDKIIETTEYNEKIDGLMSEIETLQQQLAAAKKEKEDTYAAQQRGRVRQRSKAR